MCARKAEAVRCKISMSNDCARVPHKQKRKSGMQDACYDLCACEDGSIPSRGGWRIVNVGIQLELETPNTFFIIFSRSGLKTKKGVHVRGGPSIIDGGFHDTLTIPLQNDGDEDYDYHVGDRVAQLAPLAMRDIDWVEVKQISGEGRGSYGSTGIR